MTPFGYLKICFNHNPPVYAMLIINAQIFMFLEILIIDVKLVSMA